MAAERAAINAPMQGTAADIMKIAMIEIHDWLAKGKVDARMIMQVHDEVILEVKDQDASKVEQEVAKIMQDAAKLRVPLEVESGLASNWAKPTSYRTFSNILSLKNVLLKNKEIHNPCGPSASLSPKTADGFKLLRAV